MVSNLVTIATNYFGFYKLISISWFSCSAHSSNDEIVLSNTIFEKKNGSAAMEW